MRTELTYMEWNAFEFIEQILKSELTKSKGTIMLNCSIRTINRKIVKFKNHDERGFLHKNCNKKNLTRQHPKLLLTKFCDSDKNYIMILATDIFKKNSLKIIKLKYHIKL